MKKEKEIVRALKSCNISDEDVIVVKAEKSQYVIGALNLLVYFFLHLCVSNNIEEKDIMNYVKFRLIKVFDFIENELNLLLFQFDSFGEEKDLVDGFNSRDEIWIILYLLNRYKQSKEV